MVLLNQYCALAALACLYLTLLATPLTQLAPNLPFKKQYLTSKRALGILSFLFASVHVYISFFTQLGGFEGLGFLSNKYLWAISFSAAAFLIVFLVATKPLSPIIKKLAYLAGLLILIHSLLLGSHFANLSNLIPKVMLTAVSFLLALEAIRLDKYLQTRSNQWPNLGLLFTLVLVSSLALYFNLYSQSSSPNSISVHSQHIQLAKEAQQTVISPALANFPGLQGDRTKRFTVSMLPVKNASANSDIQLEFKINDASSGNPITIFSRIYEKPMHLIIVDNQLDYFNHIHPEQKDNGFLITTQFPHDGRYHLYLDFQPLGAIEQQFAFIIDVGSVDPVTANQAVDQNLTKTFGPYKVNLNAPDPLLSSQMSIGNQTLSFTLNDSQTNQPITNLKPYLAAFGHLVMINQQTYDYLHVHPANLTAPTADANGGPTVNFLPLGLYGPIKPGTYRVFAQFNPDNKLFVADYTIKIQ